MARPHGRARVNPTAPQAFGMCDRDGMWYNLADLVWQYEYGGSKLYNKRILVCQRCYDRPAEFLRTIILPPDPLSVPNARVPNFAYEEQTDRVTQFGGLSNPPWGAGPGMIRCTQFAGQVDSEQVRILQYLTSS